MGSHHYCSSHRTRYTPPPRGSTMAALLAPGPPPPVQPATLAAQYDSFKSFTGQQTTGGAAREYGKKGPLVAAMCVTDDAQSNGEETGRTSDGSITVSRRTWSMPCSTSSCLSRAFLLFSASLFKSSMARQINQKAWWANSPEDKVDRHCRGAGAIS